MGTSSDCHPSVGKGVLAGLAGGLAASFAMNRFEAWLGKLTPKENGAEAADPFEASSTVKMAEMVSERVFHRKLRDREKDRAANAVHYLCGAAMGGVYGALAEKAPVARAGFGTVFGSMVWLLGDEIALPQLGLTRPASAYPASMHASAWVSHLVFGLTTDLVRRGIRILWS